jgi:hypothetical protein
MGDNSRMRFALVCFVTACTATSPHSKPPPNDQQSNGGTIVVWAEPEGHGVFAELFDSTTPDALVPLPAFGDGHCDVTPLIPAMPQVVDRDLGATLNLTSETEQLSALVSNVVDFGLAQVLLPTVNHAGTTYFYGAMTTSSPGFGTAWQVADAEGTLATVAIPSQVVQHETGILNVPGNDNTIHWTGGGEAQLIEIDLLGAGANATCYPVAGATSFLPSAALVAQIAGTDRQIGVEVFAKNRQVVAVDGRDVLVTGQSQNLD